MVEIGRLLCSGLVLLGFSMLGASLIHLRAIVSSPQRSRGWRALITLVFFFLAGYGSYFFIALNSAITALDWVVSSILCGGGVFVFLVTRLAKNSIAAQVAEAANADYRATHDDLTGLPNRGLLMRKVATACAHNESSWSPVSFLVMDCNHFKDINDTLGHQVGDQVLKLLAQRLRAEVRSDDLVARLSDDEFAILLPQTDLDGALVIAEKLHSVVTKPLRSGDHQLAVGASIGVACCPLHDTEPEGLLRCADTAMFAAKRHQKSIEVYAPDMDDYSKQRLWGGSAVARAIQDGEFSIVYQPKYDFRRGVMVGAEALLRWNSNQFGEVGPDGFIALSERVGLIRALSDEALRLVVQDRTRWSSGAVPIWLNLSAHDLVDEHLLDRLLSVLRRAGLSTSELGIEITETSMLVDQRQAVTNANALRQAGINLAIDDFGTGYSTLSHLAQYPVSEIKIDKEFTQNLGRSRCSDSIIKACIDMAHDLSIVVTAEGIETPEQLNALDKLGCDLAQGFLLSPPMPFDQLMLQAGASMFELSIA